MPFGILTDPGVERKWATVKYTRSITAYVRLSQGLKKLQEQRHGCKLRVARAGCERQRRRVAYRYGRPAEMGADVCMLHAAMTLNRLVGRTLAYDVRAL